jgi:hypothetical protein
MELVVPEQPSQVIDRQLVVPVALLNNQDNLEMVAAVVQADSADMRLL